MLGERANLIKSRPNEERLYANSRWSYRPWTASVFIVVEDSELTAVNRAVIVESWVLNWALPAERGTPLQRCACCARCRNP